MADSWHMTDGFSMEPIMASRMQHPLPSSRICGPTGGMDKGGKQRAGQQVKLWKIQSKGKQGILVRQTRLAVDASRLFGDVFILSWWAGTHGGSRSSGWL